MDMQVAMLLTTLSWRLTAERGLSSLPEALLLAVELSLVLGVVSEDIKSDEETILTEDVSQAILTPCGATCISVSRRLLHLVLQAFHISAWRHVVSTATPIWNFARAGCS
jgi:hypothetical protein